MSYGIVDFRKVLCSLDSGDEFFLVVLGRVILKF